MSSKKTRYDSRQGSLANSAKEIEDERKCLAELSTERIKAHLNMYGVSTTVSRDVPAEKRRTQLLEKWVIFREGGGTIKYGDALFTNRNEGSSAVDRNSVDAKAMPISQITSGTSASPGQSVLHVPNQHPEAGAGAGATAAHPPDTKRRKAKKKGNPTTKTGAGGGESVSTSAAGAASMVSGTKKRKGKTKAKPGTQRSTETSAHVRELRQYETALKKLQAKVTSEQAQRKILTETVKKLEAQIDGINIDTSGIEAVQSLNKDHTTQIEEIQGRIEENTTNLTELREAVQELKTNEASEDADEDIGSGVDDAESAGDTRLEDMERQIGDLMQSHTGLQEQIDQLGVNMVGSSGETETENSDSDSPIEDAENAESTNYEMGGANAAVDTGDSADSGEIQRQLQESMAITADLAQQVRILTERIDTGIPENSGMDIRAGEGDGPVTDNITIEGGGSASSAQRGRRSSQSSDSQGLSGMDTDASEDSSTLPATENNTMGGGGPATGGRRSPSSESTDDGDHTDAMEVDRSSIRMNQESYCSLWSCYTFPSVQITRPSVKTSVGAPATTALALWACYTFPKKTHSRRTNTPQSTKYNFRMQWTMPDEPIMYQPCETLLNPNSSIPVDDTNTTSVTIEPLITTSPKTQFLFTLWPHATDEWMAMFNGNKRTYSSTHRLWHPVGSIISVHEKTILVYCGASTTIFTDELEARRHLTRFR